MPIESRWSGVVGKAERLKLDGRIKKVFLCMHEPRVCAILGELMEKGSSKLVGLSVLGE